MAQSSYSFVPLTVEKEKCYVLLEHIWLGVPKLHSGRFGILAVETLAKHSLSMMCHLKHGNDTYF